VAARGDGLRALVLCDHEQAATATDTAREFVAWAADHVELDPVPAEATGVIEISGRWISRTWVGLVTGFSESGRCHVLVGTRGLLGEGWNAPSVNTLSDLTTATTLCSASHGSKVVIVGGGTGWPTWREAMQRALYGPDGFFRRERPADHFRTSVHASVQFAHAVSRLALTSGVERIVDIGAGRGELLAAIAERAPEVELLGVEIVPRPDNLPDTIGWESRLPDELDAALVVANEWLDNVPLDVAELDEEGRPRIVHVDPGTGAEVLGAPAEGEDADWLDRWWPLAAAEPGERAEIGHSRDSAWAGVVRRSRRSILIAIDYGHQRDDRPPYGSLRAYQDGRDVTPVPDGSRDVTAHVALDSAAAAGVEAGATSTVLISQRRALRALGLAAGLPPRSLATSDPSAYVAALSRTSEAAELLDSAGFGGFGWLVQAVGRDIPETLTP
jgi:SAM-dependent MidA family methyltransferase